MSSAGQTFLIACGGTGGHLAPGVATAEALAGRGHRPVLAVSGKRVDTVLAAQYPGLEFLRLDGVAFGARPDRLARFVFTQLRAAARLLAWMRRERPAAVLAFGGFTAAAAGLACVLARVPLVLHEANRVPGRAVRLLRPWAARVYLPEGIALPGADPAAVRHLGLPVRQGVRHLPRDEARRALGLGGVGEDGRLLAVLGGSQGARALNEWVEREWPRLAAAGVSVYALTGPGNASGTDVAPGGGPARLVRVPFSDQVGCVLSAADAVVARAGAGTLAELVRCRAPAVLVPYPYAADGHQTANARGLERAGAARVVEQDELDELAGAVDELLFAPGVAEGMRARLAGLETGDCAGRLAEELEALVAGEPRGGSGQLGRGGPDGSLVRGPEHAG